MTTEHLPSEKTDGVFIDKLAAHFSPAIIKKALTYPVRELEQETKGRWVAFVDEDAESFDVQISIEKKKVTAHYCDCKESNEQYCKHKVAVLLKIAQQSGGVNTAPKKVARKKTDPLLQLLDQVEHDDLKKWILEILLQQKDLSISFLNRFTVKPADYTPEEIQLITDKAVKSIVKNKRKIDQSELKKILLLLKDVHEPIIAYYLNNISDSEKVSVLATLLQTIEKWDLAFKIKSTKIATYKTELLARTIQPLYGIENEKVWQKVITAYFDEAVKEEVSLNENWLQLLLTMTKLDLRKERVDFMLSSFKKIYTFNKAQRNGVASSVLSTHIWELYSSFNRLPECIPWLSPIHYENSFNIKLIDALLENGYPDMAEQHCLQIIKNNYYEEYNTPYQERLMHLYADNPLKRKELHQLLLQLFPAIGTFKDYLILKDEYFKNKTDELQKWKMKILAHLAVLMRDNIESAKLLYSIYEHEIKMDKMIDKLQESATIELAVDYFEILFDYSKQKFLKNLFYFSSLYKYLEYNANFYPVLANKVWQHYTKNEIIDALSKSTPFYKGTFAKYLEKNLQL
jgi:hypothetical protein